MIIFPDIEIQAGRSVNRVRGMEHEPDIYDVSPLAAAGRFVAAGAEWLHVIDIDASLQQGHRTNVGVIREIIDHVDVPVQVGGGIRTVTDVEWWLNRGATRVVLGTAAVVDRHMIMDVCSRHPGEIVVSITGKDGFVMIDGWRTRTSFTVRDLALSFEHSGAAAIVYNDLDRFEGGPEVGLASTIDIGSRLEIPLISTGTVGTLDDISALCLLPNIEGAIVGRALFEGTVDLAEAIETARASRVPPELASLGLAPRSEDTPEIRINGIDYVGIRVRDLDRAVRFYERFGFHHQRGDTGLDAMSMKHPAGVGISLLRSSQPATSPGHIALGVESLSRTRKYLQRLGIEATSVDRAGNWIALQIKDPDDNVIELCTRR